MSKACSLAEPSVATAATGFVVNNTGGAVPNPAGNTVPRNVVNYP